MSCAFGNWWRQQTESDESLKSIGLHLFLRGWLFELTAELNVEYHDLRVVALVPINERMFYELKLPVSCLVNSNFSSTRLWCLHLTAQIRNRDRLVLNDTFFPLFILPVFYKNRRAITFESLFINQSWPWLSSYPGWLPLFTVGRVLTRPPYKILWVIFIKNFKRLKPWSIGWSLRSCLEAGFAFVTGTRESSHPTEDLTNCRMWFGIWVLLFPYVISTWAEY